MRVAGDEGCAGKRKSGRLAGKADARVQLARVSRLPQPLPMRAWYDPRGVAEHATRRWQDARRGTQGQERCRDHGSASCDAQGKQGAIARAK